MKLAKNYEPGEYEADIYALWEKERAFTPDKGGPDSFTVVMPPPNANANLHLGHALTTAVEDIATRYNRMLGKPTLLLPGADHAGFETQSVYEKKLAKEGKSRFDFSREELYHQIYDFVADNRCKFEAQTRAMGAGCDWTRYTFTLDEKIIKQAYSTFKKMWDEKLIYRGERLVNYCTFHGTGFADIEVSYEDTISPLYYLKYGPFTLATTRPETKFGDTAVAVHPEDPRYREWVDKVITVEGVNGPFEIRVLADKMVDPDFGTGVVKITPAHDFNDWEVGQRHNLEVKQVIDHGGKLNHNAGRFEGMTVLEARKAVAEALKEKDLLVKVDENYSNRVGKCYKCGTVIEPMVMEQWFVDMKPLAKRAVEALRADKITFYPSAKKTQLITYLEGLRDWNISRQIAWGIPIPAFRNINDPDEWIYNEQVDQEIIEVDRKKYTRDPDVFDTWFSSSSWPYSTLGGRGAEDFKEFYPTSLMETGGEILYPWVSRMIMLGLYETGEVPFKEVYIHGYVMAEDGSKMSKSLGNVIDPLPVIEKYGSDALRMGIISGRSPAVNRGYDTRRVEEARNFCNKLWNIARFVEGLGEVNLHKSSPEAKTIADHWILARLNDGISRIGSQLDKYRFSEAYETLYHLVWDDVADWYIEANKEQPNLELLGYVLQTILRLAHPFAPFVSETIWQSLHEKEKSLLATDSWPKKAKFDSKKSADFEKIIAIVSEIRFIKTQLKLTKGTLYFNQADFIEQNADLIARMSRLKAVSQVNDGKGLYLTQTDQKCWLDVDFATAQHFVGQLREKQSDLQKQIKTIKTRLNNENYLSKAPKNLVSESKESLNNLSLELSAIADQLKRYQSASTW